MANTGTDGSWNFQVADYNNDGKKDLWAIRKDSAKTQLHILNGADNFQTFLYRVDTYLGTTGTDYSWVFLVGDYNKDGKQDLWAIKKVSTTTEVHILNGADGFQTMLSQTATGLEASGSDNRYMFTLADYNNDGRLDVFAVKKASTGSGKTELHVLNGADGFRTFLAHIATYLGVTGTDSSWTFAAGDYNRDGRKDLYAIKKATLSTTEVHVLNGADGYQSMLTQVASVLQYTGSDSRWVFDF